MITETSNKRAFDRPVRIAQRSPSGALQRGLGTSLRAYCAVFLSAAASLAILFGGHLAATEKICRVVDEDVNKTDRSGALAPYLTRTVYPANDSTTPTGPGDCVVEAEVSPRLDSGAQLILLLDDKAGGAPQSSPKWQLINVFRGAQRLQVVRVSEMGAAQSQSTEHTVYVSRPKVNR